MSWHSQSLPCRKAICNLLTQGQGSRNFTQNLRRPIAARSRRDFGGTPRPRSNRKRNCSAAQSTTNNDQQKVGALAVFSSFISYVLLKCSGQPRCLRHQGWPNPRHPEINPMPRAFNSLSPRTSSPNVTTKPSPWRCKRPCASPLCRAMFTAFAW